MFFGNVCGLCRDCSDDGDTVPIPPQSNFINTASVKGKEGVLNEILDHNPSKDICSASPSTVQVLTTVRLTAGAMTVRTVDGPWRRDVATEFIFVLRQC